MQQPCATPSRSQSERFDYGSEWIHRLPIPTLCSARSSTTGRYLFNPDTADAVGINPVGVAVWKRMDGQRSLEEIVSEINNSFEDVSGRGLRRDQRVFVNTLAENGFVGLR